MDPDAEAAAESVLVAAERAVRQETGDDREAEQRAATATTVVGAWLRNFVDDVAGEIEAIERALAALGFELGDAPITEQTPVVDARFDALVERIERLLRAGGEFRDDERLIITCRLAPVAAPARWAIRTNGNAPAKLSKR